MENDMQTVVIKGLHRDPSIQGIPTLGLKSVNITYIGLFGSPYAPVKLTVSTSFPMCFSI